MDGECYKPSAKRKWLVFIVLKPLKMFTWFGLFYGSAGLSREMSRTCKYLSILFHYYNNCKQDHNQSCCSHSVDDLDD